jgi:pantetheine-phosphate adenylyltransferase
MPTIGVYAGSFDPITRGHEDLIRRALSFVDQLIVAVTTNVNKAPLFPVAERAEMIRMAIDRDKRVEVHPFDGLLVDFARSRGAALLIRGLRAVADFEYEYQMALMNRHLAPAIETVFMVPSLETSYISSSLVREIARLGGPLQALVHPQVAAALEKRMRSS